jgi:hypothetical protein
MLRRKEKEFEETLDHLQVTSALKDVYFGEPSFGLVPIFAVRRGTR